MNTRRLSLEVDPNTGKKYVNQYEIQRELGRGMHGKVKLAQDADGREFAIKIIPKREKRRTFTQHQDPMDKIRREVAILQKCRHENIVSLHELIDDPQAEKIYLVLEYMAGGELVWKTDQEEPALSPKECHKIFRDLLNGLEYLHHQGVIHRDIKPANLLWTCQNPDLRRIKITDFGVSVVLQSSNLEDGDDDFMTVSSNTAALSKTAGSPAFFAPELCGAEDLSLILQLPGKELSSSFLKNSVHSIPEQGTSSATEDPKVPARQDPEKRPRIGKEIDIWAVGVTLYCITFGKVPFTASSEMQLFYTICTQE